MTIILPKDYHAQQALEKNKVICITEENAERQDIRPLRIGILNIMPKAETYEFSLLNPLGRSILQIVPVWIRLESHKYTSSDQNHLDSLYVSYEKATKYKHLDGMIITGAPVGLLRFDEIKYWDEIHQILSETRKSVVSTLGICWGAFALAKVLGLEKEVYPQKYFGVFETFNLKRNHRITGSLDDVFWLPQSRYSGISKQDQEQAAKDGIINLLCESERDYPVFESADQRFLMNSGHFEYNASRIVEEVQRDKSRDDVALPENFDIEKPLNRWRGQRNEFFSQWVKYCYEETAY